MFDLHLSCIFIIYSMSKLIKLCLIFIGGCGLARGNGAYEFLRCQLCQTKRPEGQIKDCSCDFETVDDAVENFFLPILKNLTER